MTRTRESHQEQIERLSGGEDGLFGGEVGDALAEALAQVEERGAPVDLEYARGRPFLLGPIGPPPLTPSPASRRGGSRTAPPRFASGEGPERISPGRRPACRRRLRRSIGWPP